MKKIGFYFVISVAFIAVSLGGCGSQALLKKEDIAPSPPLAKVMAPETKREVPVAPPAQASGHEIKKEVTLPPPSIPVPAPKKKKKG